jgi:mono/diheme cytochrome c family protein
VRIALLLALAVTIAACARSAKGPEAAASAAALAKNPASASDGAVVYIANCSSCHQADGSGIPGAFPPLAGNPVVTGNPIAVIAIVKNGLDGKIVADGSAYSGIMPRWKGVISDDQLAAVITYIRSAWHNRAGGVSAADVQAVK